jgi:hypothetical protein
LNIDNPWALHWTIFWLKSGGIYWANIPVSPFVMLLLIINGHIDIEILCHLLLLINVPMEYLKQLKNRESISDIPWDFDYRYQ